MAPDRWHWLASTHDLQQNTYGYDLEALADGVISGAPPELTEKLAKYIDWNSTAAVQELAEVREEFSWKPWATDAPFVNRNRVLNEIVDTLHFLGNILVGMGVTDSELEAAYQAKQTVNRVRVASQTYSAQKGGLAMGSDIGG